MTGDRYILAVAATTVAVWGALILLIAYQDPPFRRKALLVTAVSVILLARLPAFFGAQTVIQAAVVGILLAATGLASRGRARWTWASGAVFFYVGLLVVALLRGARAGVYQTIPTALVEGTLYVTIAAFALVLVANAESDKIRNERLAALALAPAFYCLVNAILYFGGITSRAPLGIATETTTSLLELAGVSMYRVQFAFATAVNSMGIVGAIGLASCIVLFARRAAPTWATVPGIFGSLVVLVLSDTRAALIICLLVAAWFAWGKRTIGARWIALAVPILPLALMWLITRNENNLIGSLLSRDAGDFATGNGRTKVWTLAWNTVGQWTPEHIFGWGANGQITSGASFDYAHVFGGQKQPWRFSTHDIALQMILDMGVVGLLALMLAVFVSTSALQEYMRGTRRTPAPALLAVIVTAILCGVTEVSPSYGTQEALLATLLAMGGAVGLAAVAHAPAPARQRVPRRSAAVGRT